MNLLLDTHILLWWATDSPYLPTAGRTLLADQANTVYFSSLAIWEVAIKHAKGFLSVPPDVLRGASLEAGLLELHFTASHAVRAGALPPHHHDPFDRGMVGQALVQAFVLVSQDEKLRLYDVPLRYF